MGERRAESCSLLVQVSMTSKTISDVEGLCQSFFFYYYFLLFFSLLEFADRTNANIYSQTILFGWSFPKNKQFVYYFIAQRYSVASYNSIYTDDLENTVLYIYKLYLLTVNAMMIVLGSIAVQ